jgi:hypothetical protein
MAVFSDPKSALMKFMASIDPTGSSGGDLVKLLNTPVLLTIVHNKVERDGDTLTYANITGLLPVPDGFPVGPLMSTPFAFDTMAPDVEALKSMPKYLREKIAGSVGYKGSVCEAAIVLVEGEVEEKAGVKPPAPSSKAPY